VEKRFLIIVPTYNEIENIQVLLDQILELPKKVQVLVIDDSSPDGTGKLVSEIANTSNQILLHLRLKKEGVASAYLFGLNYAVKHDFDWAICMDSDLSHRVEDLAGLLNSAMIFPETSLIIGSRYVTGGKVTNIGWYRRALSRFGNIISRRFIGTSLRDVTGGFRAYNVECLKLLHLQVFSTKGYGFQMQLIYSILNRDGDIREIPINFMPRLHGKSKLTTNIMLQALYTVGMLGWSRLLSKIFHNKQTKI
jgi:dolichol-phosphate mannosyltransferase